MINFTQGKKPDMPLGLYMGLDYKLPSSNIKWIYGPSKRNT